MADVDETVLHSLPSRPVKSQEAIIKPFRTKAVLLKPINRLIHKKTFFDLVFPLTVHPGVQKYAR